MFNSKPLEERAEALVKTALDNGSTDNVSIVIADLKASEWVWLDAYFQIVIS